VPVRKILGIGFEFAGRVYGAKKAATFKMLLGSVPFNTLDARIDYSYIMQKTRNGT
jgi:ribosomal protein S3